MARGDLSTQSAGQEAGFAASLGPLLILALLIAVGFTAMGSFGMVQESAKVELHLSDTALGLLQGLGAAVPLVVFSVPIGILVDRYNRVRLLVGLMLLWTLGTALTAAAPDVSTLFAARMLTGIGVTGALTAALSLSADFCRPAQRGRALLIVNLGKSLGTAAAFALTGWIFGLLAHGAVPAGLAMAPWRGAHAILAGIGLLLSLPLLALREPPRHEVEAAPNSPFRVVAAELWARREFLAPLFAGQVAVVMADAAAGIWVSPVLQRSYGLSPEDFGGWVGAIVFISGVLGSMLGGASADLGQKSSVRGGLLVGAVIAAGVGVPSALFPVMPNVLAFGAALFVLVLCGAITGLVVSVALTVWLPNELRGLSIGAFIAVAGLIGFGLAPSLVTVVSGVLGGETHLGQGLAVVGVVTSALSFLAFIQAMRRAPI
ncbi:MFS transporter [Porphyrobacter algicida]|uniref:MFS transporter n=2 Tax=Qipengyuania algicida TaxID=1836209 RepID=A0A845ALG9_9SPHN|nr:MFS transporter [Qipengyuania algicida]